MRLVTPSGDSIHLDPHARGLHLVLVPGEPPSPDAVDVFQLGLNFSSIGRLLQCLRGGPFVEMNSGRFRASVEGGIPTLRFELDHDPGRYHSVELDESSAATLARVLEELLQGGSGGTRPEPRTPDVARNEPCPCGSGKKYKRCCMRSVPEELPTVLDPFAALEAPVVMDLLDVARRNQDVLSDARFWGELAVLVGSQEHHDLALMANLRAVELDPADDGFKLNLAVTQGLLGDMSEALELVDTVSDEQPRKAVIRANLLQNLGRHEEAIPLYERAVAEEPDFYLPWARLLGALRATHSPMFEYWLQRAVAAVPESPVVAREYCFHLLRTHRLDELVDADWIDRLESSAGRPDIVGRDEDTPQLIVEAQLFRWIGVISATHSLEALHQAVSALVATPKEWHLCDVARLLTASAANLGEVALVESAYGRICEQCQTKEEDAVSTFMARAQRVAGEHTSALHYAELSLQGNPEDKVALWESWWCLDELGRADEAIETATRLYELAPGYPQLAYNLGWLHQKVGTLGSARRFYEAAVDLNESDYLAQENLAFVLLLEGEVEQAERHFSTYLEWAGQLVPEALLDPEAVADDGRMVVVIAGRWSPGFKAEQTKWRTLVAHAEQTTGSPSFAFDLVLRNEASEPIIASKTTLRPSEYSIDRMIDALMNPGTDSEIAHQLRMRQRGDFSGLWAQFADRLTVWEQLPHEAKLALLEAERRLSSGGAADHAPDVMSFAKAVEIALKRLVFDPYAEVAKRDPEFDAHVALALDEKFRKTHGFVRFLERGQHLELGSMLFALRLCRGKTGRRLALVGRLRSFVEEQLGWPSLLTDESLTDLDDLTGLRNPAAHASSFDLTEAREARELALRQLDRFGSAPS